MSSNNARNGREFLQEQGPSGTKKIDLQGVASFAAIVELLAQELGTTPGKIHGNLPNGTSFNELVGEIELNNQGFNRKLILFAQPGSPLTLRFRSVWNEGTRSDNKPRENDDSDDSGIIADYFLAATVEQILPQGRAMARYVEDIFAVLDRMVSLGQANRLANMSIPASTIEAFEQSEASNLVRSYAPKNNS
jgi:hypothetical protein